MYGKNETLSGRGWEKASMITTNQTMTKKTRKKNAGMNGRKPKIATQGKRNGWGSKKINRGLGGIE